MNKEETLKVAVEALETGVPYEGGCIWDQKAASHKIGADWGNEYVEIDLNVQEVYFYRDGSCLWSSNCVSGNPAKNNRTITGVYSIQSKELEKQFRWKHLQEKRFSRLCESPHLGSAGAL